MKAGYFDQGSSEWACLLLLGASAMWNRALKLLCKTLEMADGSQGQKLLQTTVPCDALQQHSREYHAVGQDVGGYDTLICQKYSSSSCTVGM